ncbi:hypothetical protein [Mesorhizobium sp.]|uniref:hypothetical protein n=1 Tax=Mesorhizobium sp. TaxID=1871066 RepID=UPI00257BA942|nr:hypothetical protein [Mesorhizobium sp.]
MTKINRSQPHVKPDLAKTNVEMKLLDHLLPDKDPTTSHAGTLSSYLVIDRAIGWQSRACQPPAAGQHRHVARPYAPHGHQTRAQPSEPNL